MSTILEGDLWVGPGPPQRPPARRRTVSHSAETGTKGFRPERRAETYAGGLAELGEVRQAVEPAWAERLRSLPGLGIVLNLCSVLLWQSGNVMFKKMAMNPFVFLLWRDSLRMALLDLPTITFTRQHPFPVGSRVLLLVRGIAAGLQGAVMYYAVKILPLADYTMLLSLKSVFVTLLSCVFLKESCGIFEIANLVLILTGVTLVIQPPFLFGVGETEEYSGEMVLAAAALTAAVGLGSTIPVILRRLRHLHWAALASSNRIISILEYVPLVLYLGEQCFPACGYDRLKILAMGLMASVIQMLNIHAFKLEEAHIIGLVDISGNIVVAFIFQTLFFPDPTGPLKLLGAGVVLSSVLLIGGSKVWQHGKGK
jgi:drug/metabolite transporter (DMT)-like permease